MNTRFLLFASVYLGLGSVIVCAFAILLPYTLIFDPDRRLYLRIFYLFHQIVSNLFWETKVTGHPLESCPIPSLFVINHQTVLDSLVIFKTPPHHCRLMVFHNIRLIPVVGLIHIFIGNIFVDRSSGESGDAAIRAAVQSLKAGFSLVISPEGRFNTSDKLLPFRIGPFEIACMTGTPLVPVKIETRRLFDRTKKLNLLPGSLHLHIFEPIDPTGMTPETVRETAYQTIQNHVLP